MQYRSKVAQTGVGMGRRSWKRNEMLLSALSYCLGLGQSFHVSDAGALAAINFILKDWISCPTVFMRLSP